MLTTGAISPTRGCGMGKVKRGKGKATKTAKAPSRIDQYLNVAAVADPGTMARWQQKLTIERIDEANQVRREVFDCLTLRDRVIVEGGRVTQKGAHSQFEHPALDSLKAAGILDDPLDAGRAEQRVLGGVELLRMGVDGNVFPRSTAAWRDVNGGGGGGPPTSVADQESYAARAEMKYLRARDVVGAADWEMIRSICIDASIPPGTKRRKLCNALDLLCEYLLGIDPPRDVIRPRPRLRDQTIPAWLKTSK